MLRLEKVATPLAAATVVVPDTVPPAGFVPIVTVTLPVRPDERRLGAASGATWPGGARGAPAVVLVGCTVKRSWLGVPSARSKGVLVAPLIPVAVAARV